MSKRTADPEPHTTLRQRAQHKLDTGTAPTSRGWGVSVEALALLHRLASAPASAADALKLLHELQVHQVELDLQHAQIEANEAELADELARYRALYMQAPAAHFVLDADGRIVECNRAGADLLGRSSSEISGRRFDEFLSSDSRVPFATLLRDVRDGAANPCCTVRPARERIDARHWQIAASAGPSDGAVQLIVTAGAGPATD